MDWNIGDVNILTHQRSVGTDEGTVPVAKASDHTSLVGASISPGKSAVSHELILAVCSVKCPVTQCTKARLIDEKTS